MINSANDEVSLDALEKAEAIAAITEWLVARGAGEATTTYKLRDWLFSRQRYWGEPFPIVYDENDLPVAVPDSMLPVLLPEVDDYSPKTFADDDADSKPEAPLSRAADWVSVELDLGDGPKRYRRETNTMPNWAGLEIRNSGRSIPHTFRGRFASQRHFVKLYLDSSTRRCCFCDRSSSAN